MRCTCRRPGNLSPRSPLRTYLVPVLDGETGRRRLEFDAEVLEERSLVIGVIDANQELMQRRVDPVQPALIARLDCKSVSLGPPGVDGNFVFVW